MERRRHSQNPKLVHPVYNCKASEAPCDCFGNELFRKMLLEDAEFKPLRQSLQKAGYPLVLHPSDALMLVRPDEYLETVSMHVCARILQLRGRSGQPRGPCVHTQSYLLVLDACAPKPKIHEPEYYVISV